MLNLDFLAYWTCPTLPWAILGSNRDAGLTSLESTMSEFSAKKLRDAMKSKIARLISRTDPKAKVDASGYTPPDAK